jgi:ankyrin repeat protein
MVRRLLAHSAIDPNGGNPLLKAASQGHWEVLQALLVGDRINVNVANSSGESALMLAVAQGRIDIVKCLLDVESIDINHEDCRGNTALIIAACAGNADIVSSLLAHSRIDPNRGMPMLRAAQHHHWHVAEQFFQVPHINFNSVDDDNLTILCHAVKSGRLRETTSLLGHAEIDVHQGGPLIHAVMYGRVNMTRVLLDAPGFAVARAAAQKDVALSIAISNGRSAIEKMLREHGANTIWRRR